MSKLHEYTHPEYDSLHKKWDFAWKSYTGECYDDGEISNFLFQKEQRESNKAYDGRKKDSDPILHFPTAVDGLCGIIFSKADSTEREWGALGDPEKEGSRAHYLTHNADGSGTNWGPHFKQVAIRQTVMHRIYGLVEGVVTETDEKGDTIQTLEEASIKTINPQAVVNWYPSTGNPTQVLVKEKRDIRTSIEGDPEMKDVFTLYTLDGWKRFYIEEFKDANGKTDEKEVVIGTGEYTYYASSRRKVRVLPIFRVDIPMPRFVGYLLAQKQNHIFNFKSARDWGASILSFALLKLVGSEKQVTAILKGLEGGANYLTQDPEASQSHDYLSPASDHLSECGEILEKDTEHFYLNAFKEYGDAAAQRTATEIRLESKTGIEAFLALLVSSLDEFENQCFLRLMQVYFPDNPAEWGTAFVKRTANFQPEDIDAAMENMKKQFLGDGPIPIDNKTKVDVVKKLLAHNGITIEQDDSLKKVLESSIDGDTADALAKIREFVSIEEAVKILRPYWEDGKVKAEAERINRQRGAIDQPANMVGG